MGLWSDITGGLDHAAGSVDESVGRQFDNTEGGGFLDQAQDFAFVTEHRENDDFVFTGAPRQFADTVWDYDQVNYQEDTVDLPGPATTPSDVSTPSEWIPDAGIDPLNTRKWLPILVVVVFAYGFLQALAGGIGEGLAS